MSQSGLRAMPMDGMQTQMIVERRLHIPAGAPPRLIEDIESYSALVALQGKMTGASSWYQQLA